MKHSRILALAGVVALLAAACSGGASGTAAPSPQASIGAGEGELNLVIWAGYAERGAVDPAYDWVTPFEEKTGCKVNTTDMTDSNNGVSLIQSGNYDGISASGDATTRLIAGGDVSPINTAILPNYANVFDGLKNLPHNTVDGVNYGVPHGRGPNLLGYNTEAVTPAPTSWDVMWEGGSAYKDKISVYDSSIYIADAALHLMNTKPELGIKDPYQLNDAQFAEAIKLLEMQRDNGATYWGTFSDQVAVVLRGRRRRGHDLAVPDQPAPGREPADRGRPPGGGLHGLVRHLDARQQGQAPELHAHVDGPHDVGRGQRPGDRLVRRGADQPAGLRGRGEALARPLRADARHGRGLLRQDLVLDHPAGRLRGHGRGDHVQDPGRLGGGVDEAPRRVSLRLTA